MERIAIVGSGISGLGCAWFLHRNFDITVFEADDRIGGHSHTIGIEEGDSTVRLDTGFMVYNNVTYPHLSRLFAELDVPTKPTSMSFSVQHLASRTEWTGSGLGGLFGQRKNLFNLRHWQFLLQLNRFNREAVDALEEPAWQELTLAEYVEERGYGKDLLERYLIPMAGAVWSTPPEKMLDFPAVTLLRFWFNHGFLGLHTQHPWRTVEGGSREYVERLIHPIRDRIHTSTPISKVERTPRGVTLHSPRFSGNASDDATYDKVVLATHAPATLRMLAEPTPLEEELLTPFAYQPNEIHVHGSASVMPRTRRCWASWNYKAREGKPPGTHYWMNSLQGVSRNKDYFVSLNSRDEIRDAPIHRELDYEHPLFDLDAIGAQKRLPELNRANGNNRTFFAGAWFRYGFHEDGLLSAVNVCEQLLGGDPWEKR